MLSSIALVNFKCFNALHLPCAPLNLLCGLNGMGKSSVIQALLVLRQSFASKELEAGHLVLGGDLIDLGAGSDVLFEDAIEPVIQFVLHDERTRSPGESGRCPVTGKATGSIFSPGGDAKARSILNKLLAGRMKESDLDGCVANPGVFRRAFSRARKEGVKQVQAPSRYFDDERTRSPGESGRCPVTGKATGSIFSPGGDATARSILNELLAGRMKESDLDGRVANPGVFRRAFSRARKEGVKQVQAPSRYFDSMARRVWTAGFAYSRTSDELTAVAVDSERAEKGRLLEMPDPDVALDELMDWRDVPPFGGHFHYVQAERVGPRKSYPLSEVAARRDDLGSCGEYTWNYLNDHRNDLLRAEDPRCADAPGRRLVDVVDHWLQDVSPGAHLQLEAVPTADAVLAGFTFDRPGDVETRRHRATNVGFGLSYVLPVVLALLAPPGALCLIENPEAHLHPRGQTKLAELAVRAAQAGVQVFVETHSDHFVDGVRIAVRDGLIKPSDAAIHYFERRDGHVEVSSPAIDADGRLSHWPAGFFDQHDENLARLLAPRA